MSLLTHGQLLASSAYGADPHWDKVLSLLHFNGPDESTSFVDMVSGTSWTATAGAQIDTAQAKFGESSCLFPTGVNSNYGRLDSNTNAAFALGTGDFTIEGFYRLPGSKSGARILLDQRPLANGLYPTIYIDGNQIYYNTNSAQRISSAAAAINLAGAWQHWALCRVEGGTRLFVNGAQVGSTYSDSNNYGGTRFRYGNTAAANNFDNLLGGHLDECRITKGLGRYPGAFTPPAAEFLAG